MLPEFFEGAGVVIACRFESELLGGEVANGLAVHGEIDGACGGGNLYAALLEVVEPFGADGFYLGDDDVGLVLVHGTFEGVAVEHGEDFAFVGDLHGGCSGIGIARYDVLT